MRVSLLMLSVLWRHIWPVLRVYCARVQKDTSVFFCTVHNTHAQQVKIRRHNTDNINNDTRIGTRYVILAKHWIRLPDDGSMRTETCWSSFYNFNCLMIQWFYNLCALVGQYRVWLYFWSFRLLYFVVFLTLSFINTGSFPVSDWKKTQKIYNEDEAPNSCVFLCAIQFN
jgi:hypothetical protein